MSELTDIVSDLIVPFAEQDHRVAQYAPRYRLSFTLLNEDAAVGGSVNEWSVSDAISRQSPSLTPELHVRLMHLCSGHVSPILTQLSVLHNFTIESQVQFHAPLAFKPRVFDNAYGITPEDLTVFVNSAEWTLCKQISALAPLSKLTVFLASSASNDPVLHFVLFVPSASRRPLYIMNHQGMCLVNLFHFY